MLAHIGPLGQGLSPRVRGKLSSTVVLAASDGSIPACAGETPKAGGTGGKEEVYPRVCGGNQNCHTLSTLSSGLSPRVRGKHHVCACRRDKRRSIPACAGETYPQGCSSYSAQVYPRVCGGNSHAALWTITSVGLSPRVRGKPTLASSISTSARSIPACAGETYAAAFVSAAALVYPRVCGGNPTTY